MKESAKNPATAHTFDRYAKQYLTRFLCNSLQQQRPTFQDKSMFIISLFYSWVRINFSL